MLKLFKIQLTGAVIPGAINYRIDIYSIEPFQLPNRPMPIYFKSNPLTMEVLAAAEQDGISAND